MAYAFQLQLLWAIYSANALAVVTCCWRRAISLISPPQPPTAEREGGDELFYKHPTNFCTQISTPFTQSSDPHWGALILQQPIHTPRCCSCQEWVIVVIEDLFRNATGLYWHCLHYGEEVSFVSALDLFRHPVGINDNYTVRSLHLLSHVEGSPPTIRVINLLNVLSSLQVGAVQPAKGSRA